MAVNKSLRLRLTLLYSGFFAVMFVLFGIILYGSLSHSLYARLDETLASEADTAAALFADEYEELGRQAIPAAREVVEDMKLRGDFLAVMDGTRVLASKPAVSLTEVAGPRRRSAVRQVPLDGMGYRVIVSATLEPIHAALAEFGESSRSGCPWRFLLRD